MSALRPLLAALLALGLTTMPLAAQEAAPTDEAAAGAENGAEAPAATPGFSPGQEVSEGPQPGQDYVAATHGDWEVRCVHTADGFDPCRIYQLLLDGQENPVAEFAMVALDEAGAAAGATIVTPLETLLTAQLTLQVDAGTARRYPFSWCSREGCVARAGLTSEELTAFKKGAKATVTIVPVIAPDQQVSLAASLTGFTAAFDDMAARNAETRKRAEEAAAAGEGGDAGEAPAGD